MRLVRRYPTVRQDNTYFRKIFRQLAVTTFILFFCFTLIITFFTTQRYTREAESGSRQTLDVTMAINESTLNSLYNYCYFLFNNNIAVNDILYADSFSPKLSISSSTLQNDFLNYYSLVESFYLINFQADMVFSNTTTCLTVDGFYDQDIISLLQGKPTLSYSYTLIPRTIYNTHTGDESDVISLIIRASNGNAFVINLSRSSYEALLNRNLNTLWSDPLVINHDGYTINGIDEIGFNTDVAESEWYQNILKAGFSAGSLSVWLGSTQYTVFYQKNAAFRLTYVIFLAVSPFSTQNTMLYSTLGFFVLFTLIAFGLSLLLSYTLCLPISNLMKQLKSYGKHMKDNYPDELSYLTEAVTDLMDTSRKGQKQIYLTEKASCLHRILTVADYYDTIDKAVLAKYHISMEAEYYQVIMFSLDRSAALLSSNPKDHKLMMDSLQNIASELLPDSFCIEIEYGIWAYILFPGVDEANSFIKPISEIKQCMDNYFQETITVGIGSVCESPSDLYKSYTHAKLALRYRFLSGGNSILNYSDFPKQTGIHLMAQEQKDIAAALLACKEALALEKLDAYFEALASTHIDNIIMNIMALNTSFQNVEIQSGLLFMDNLSYDNDPYNHYTIKELQAQFEQRVRSDIAQLLEIKQNISAKPQIIEEVSAIVEANLLSADLTVESIASQVQLSTNYLRNVFKEHMGISLSKYITDKKIQYACKKLTETEDSIQSLCEQLDFTSVNYFYTYFKRHTGMTPSQYRENFRGQGKE